MGSTRQPTLTVSISGKIALRVKELARRRRRSAQHIVRQACQKLVDSMAADSLDDAYERGYRETPEDTTDLEALLPHLPLPVEGWE